MAQELPLDELTIAVSRIQGLLLTQEKVDDAVLLLARAWAAEEPVLINDLAAGGGWNGGPQ